MTTPTPSTPTPNDMPGASPQPNPQLQQPVSTEPPAPAPTPPAPADPQALPATGGPDTVEYWKSVAREWENRSKIPAVPNREMADKAKKWDEHEASQRTNEENQRLALAEKDREIAELKMGTMRERIARETGVLPQFLTGNNEDEMRQAAAQAIEWRGSQPQPVSEPPKPTTSAVPASTVTSADTIGSPNGVPQLTKEQFAALPPAERMVAVRAGQCVNLGVGVPKKQRRMGNQLDIGASIGGPQAGPPGPGQPIIPA